MSTQLGTAPIGARRLRLGTIGGGQGAYIGGIHRFAARLDGQYDLVAGAFDIDAARGHAFAVENHIAPERSYDDYRPMIEAERQRPDCVDVVAICTPNHTHFPIGKSFLEAGFDVICEKPLTTARDGLKGVAFVDAVVNCHKAGEPRWIKPPYT